MNARLSCLLWLLLLALVNACTEPDGPVEQGALVLETVTTGGDLDLNGYLVVINGQPYRTEANGQLRVDVEAGVHRFELKDLAPNCDVTTNGVRKASEANDGRVHVLFEVYCYPTGIEITTSVNGIDLDRWFEIFLNDNQRIEFARLNGMTAISSLAPGTYTVRLHGESNCQLEPESRVVEVTFRTMSPITFTGRCVAATGVVRVRVSQHGEDLDITGFTASLDGEPAIAVDGSLLWYTEVQPGARAVRLSGVATNCSAAEENPARVMVKAGGAVRDTVTVDFTLSCTRQAGIAMLRNGQVTIATREGATLDVGRQAAGAPQWSPDGRRLAFSCGGVCVADLQTGHVDTYVGGTLLGGVSWRPDGRQLISTDVYCIGDWGMDCRIRAFTFIDAIDGTLSTIPAPAGLVWGGDPTWSPDEQWIAFSCRVDAALDAYRICRMRPDGAGFQQLTAGSGSIQDFSPSWSPDSRKLVFMTSRFGGSEIVTMNADGSGLARLGHPAQGYYPSWLPDVMRILYSVSYAQGGGLTLINLDGSAPQTITTNTQDYYARWRP